MFDLEWRQFLEKYKRLAAESVPSYISANDITLMGMVISLVGCVFHVYGFTIIGFILNLLSILTDALDGGVSRLRGTASDYGGYLDLTTDFVTYCAIPAAFAIKIDEKPEYLALVYLLSSFACNAASSIWFIVILEKRKSAVENIKHPRNLCEADTTYIFLVLLYLFEAWSFYLFIGYGTMVFAGIVQRTIYIRDHHREWMDVSIKAETGK